jgi:hypothetical protein
MSEQALKEWVKTCSCNCHCYECDKTPEKCRQDLYKIAKSLLTRTKLPPEENTELFI